MNIFFKIGRMKTNNIDQRKREREREIYIYISISNKNEVFAEREERSETTLSKYNSNSFEWVSK